MKVQFLRQGDDVRFEDLANSYGTIFNTTRWTKIFGNIEHVGIYNDNDVLIGGFLLYREKRYGMTIFRNPPFTPAIGPFLRIDAQNEVGIMNTWKEALSAMAEFIDSLSYSIVSCALSPGIIDTQPFIWKKFKVVPGYTYIINLSLSHDEALKKVAKVRKNEIKKTLADGLSVEKIDDLTIIKNLVLKTFSRQGEGIDQHQLDRILFDFADHQNSYAFVTFKGRHPVAGTLCVIDNNTAYALIGGYDEQQKHRGAGASADWACIMHAKEIGLKYFDFEGSMIPQVEKYLRNFGGNLTPYYTINKAKLPFEIALKFFKRERF